MRYNEEKLTHGGARNGAGRPATPVDERRVLVLRKEGLTILQIAERFGVTAPIIKRVLRKMEKESCNKEA